MTEAYAVGRDGQAHFVKRRAVHFEMTEFQWNQRLTDNHASELEAFPDALPVDLVGEVCESNITHELFPDDVAECRGAAVDSGSRAVCSTVPVLAARSVRLG